MRGKVGLEEEKRQGQDYAKSEGQVPVVSGTE